MTGKIGKISIVLAFVLSSISPYVILFTIPVFIVGALLLWFSKKKILTKVLWTVLPILLWYPAFGIFMFIYGTIGTATAQKFDFILPNGFKGDVVVVGNIPCGQPVKKKEGREQLFVPDNGMLLYQGDVRDGYINHKYYYLLDDGKLQPLPGLANYMYYDSEKNQLPTDTVGVWLGGMGMTVSSEKESPIEYCFMTLTVDSKDSINLRHDFQKERLFQSSIDSLVRDCEEKKI